MPFSQVSFLVPILQEIEANSVTLDSSIRSATFVYKADNRDCSKNIVCGKHLKSNNSRWKLGKTYSIGLQSYIQ